jgi:hypothetical protein
MFRSIVRSIVIAGIALVVVGLLVPNANAQRYDKKTTITVNQPFEIPGVALPAGTYVMKLVDVAGTRTIVRFMNSDENAVYATVLGIPDYKLNTPENSEFSFYETTPGVPRALRSWFYPGDNYGVEFVYPKAKALEIAKAAEEPVMAIETPAETEWTEQALIEEPVFTVQPSGEEVAIAEAPAEQPLVAAPLEPEPAPPVEALPKTATPFALVGLVGLLAGGMATGLRFVRRH